MINNEKNINKEYETFRNLCLNLHQYDHLHIASPPQQKRRAAVAAILRWHRGSTDIYIDNEKRIDTLEEFFEQPWVKEDVAGQAEILFMQRTARVGDRWSGHVSFVGGKNEPTDTNDEDTVKREVLEEIDIDLNNKEQYLKVGLLDEREISSIRDNKLLMILIPFVYLQIAPTSPPFQLQPSEVAAVECIGSHYRSFCHLMVIRTSPSQSHLELST
ncbi:hypothetical protein BDF20DRAFT_232001 [Mycotypha africana]|uniref:uncharacterized protein n=1 Tax=Mycotypha africana TaxID=64632 RepID=UPI002301C12C|nr:uncharacterized protein BDF20DRAFT_232001 [Mycotypha africana]KAI8967380.1 hypothetical protein BDF20DRAFT_232001 [Mycotypha africana]